MYISKGSLCSHSVLKGTIPFDQETLLLEIMAVQFMQSTGMFPIPLKTEETELCELLPLNCSPSALQKEEAVCYQGAGKRRFDNAYCVFCWHRVGNVTFSCFCFSFHFLVVAVSLVVV